MKYVFYIILSLIVLFLIGTGIDNYNKGSEERAQNRCLKKVGKNEKYKNIDEAIANYDFVVARKYLNCYSEEMAGASNPRRNKLKEIVKAEVAFNIKNGDISRAKSVASESGFMYIYTDALPNAIDMLLEKQNYNKIFFLLSTWEIEHPFNPNKTLNYPNSSYNDEVIKYNQIIDNILKFLILNKDQKNVIKLLKLYKPIAVATKATAHLERSKQHGVLKNKDRDAARKLVIEAGMRIK